MNNYQKYLQSVIDAQNEEREAQQIVDADLEKMRGILQKHISAAIDEIREGVGWAPPSISVEMIDASTMSDPEKYVLGNVSASV